MFFLQAGQNPGKTFGHSFSLLISLECIEAGAAGLMSVPVCPDVGFVESVVSSSGCKLAQISEIVSESRSFTGSTVEVSGKLSTVSGEIAAVSGEISAGSSKGDIKSGSGEISAVPRQISAMSGKEERKSVSGEVSVVSGTVSAVSDKLSAMSGKEDIKSNLGFLFSFFSSGFQK